MPVFRKRQFLGKMTPVTENMLNMEKEMEKKD